MRVIAHRGWSGKYPENTMLAFRKAVEAGCDGIELDVHLSKDGEVMIIHDEALKRTSGMNGAVSEWTRSELEKISAGKTFNDDYGFTPIPSLEEYLEYVSKTGVITNIELKTAPCYYPGIERKTLDLVRKFGYEDRVIFSSFNWLSVFEMKKLAPELPGGFLLENLSIQNISMQIKSLGFEYYHPCIRYVSDELVRECKANKVGLNVWTVNDAEDIKKCIAWDIEGLITNHPDIAFGLIGK